jgi:hypothetical protein
MSKSLMIGVAATLALAGHITQAEASFSRSGSKTQCFPTGNCDGPWASGYSASGRITYTQEGAAGIAGDTLEAEGELTAWVKMMDERQDVAILRGNGFTTIGGSRRYEVEVLARTPLFPGTLFPIYSNSWTGTLSESRSWPLWTSVSKQIGVGPVSVDVTMSARGTLGFSLTGAVGANGISAVFTPRVNAVTEGETGVNTPFASAGVYGDLTLLSARMPVDGSVALDRTSAACNGPGVNWGLDVDLSMHSLDGEIGVFAELLGAVYRVELFSWAGFAATYHPYSGSGTVCL